MIQALITCREVSRTYGSGERSVVAVHDVTCTVTERSRVALTGPSGSGKTTLLQLMGGLDTPTTGSIAWPGLGGAPHDDQSRVGIVFQGESLVPALTALENVALPLVLRGVRHGDALARARVAMQRLGLESFADQLPDELSGGQAQRTSVARVLTMRPRLILADEPTGQLDQLAGAQVVDVLLTVADELGSGVVVTTHDPHVAGRLQEEWRMRDGALSVAELTGGIR
ncbi:MAG: ABC transporter ATP-binding protein [Nocardioides sp.]